LQHFRPDAAYLIGGIKMTHFVHLQLIRITIYKMKFRFSIIGMP
jgi:hypothetical protein